MCNFENNFVYQTVLNLITFFPQILHQLSGFIDIDKINPDACPALVADLSAGENGIIALAFGGLCFLRKGCLKDLTCILVLRVSYFYDRLHKAFPTR